MMTPPQLRALSLGLTTLILAGCNGSQPSSYYLLSSLPAPRPPVQSASSDQLAIGVGPVTLPAYLDRPQLVTRASANRLDLAEFDRWAEPLPDMFARTLAEDLSAIVGTDQVLVVPDRFGPELDYQVAVEVLRFDRSAGGEIELLARWTILTGNEAETLAARKSLITERASQDSRPEEIIVAMSRTVEMLSREIAGELQAIAGRRPSTGYDLISIQTELRSKGYDPGPVDGLMGPKTREAIRRFQGDQGVRVTGEPSAQLHDMLMSMP
jgi:uncharacterized protein